jgi:hypothetical protein
MRAPSNKPMRYRQIHLDFHTSEHIDGIGVAFDPDDFAATFKAAHVDSVTVFAKCHHGWSYYPTEVGEPHPHLARKDLMGEMMAALAAVDIETPVYVSVQWDERNARLHPEWRAMSASNQYQHAIAADPSAGKQLSPAWHTLCLNHQGYREEILAQAREIASTYDTPGLFFDIILTPDCVCPSCVERMVSMGRDPENPEDRLANDEEVNERFRRETSGALATEFPGLRVFYNCGHIHKQGARRFEPYSHLEIESLPTGGWGYDHFPSSARYAAALGMDYVGHTGKFHTSWGEFGGFKHPQALDYECAQMVALGSKCLVGDQLHPNGAINKDTYRSIAPAYDRVARLEPYLKGARQISEIALLSAEHFNPAGGRNHPSDDGAAQMLQELKYPFDVIDSGMALAGYRLIIVPDDIVLDEAMAGKLREFHANGGKLILSDKAGLDAAGRPVLPAGIEAGVERHAFDPSYIAADAASLPDMPESPFVVYGSPRKITATGADVLAQAIQSYFNRSFRAWCSHQHTPDDPSAAPLGPAVTEHGGIAYVAYPIFEIYHRVGQPLYKHLVADLIRRLMPDAALKTDLPSSGRATLTVQEAEGRHVLHLLYGAPQVRGHAIPADGGGTRVMEMIEDVPALGPVTATVRLPRSPSRVYDALTGEEVVFALTDDEAIAVSLPGLKVHSAVVFEDSM